MEAKNSVGMAAGTRFSGLSVAFLGLSVLGIGEAFYHAWSENAFTTNWSLVHFSPMGAFLGIPYWVFGIVWFPLLLVVGLWATRAGRSRLGGWLLVLLTVGNLFTAWLWYLDLIVIGSYTVVYVALYATNYFLTALVVLENRRSDVMRGYAYGTVTGAIIGVLFGPYGVAVVGIGGGIFGALRNYAIPPQPV